MKPPFKRVIVDIEPDMFQKFEQLAFELRNRPQVEIKPYLGQRRRMTQAIGRLKVRQALIRPCLLHVLARQPYIDIYRRNATNHDAQRSVYEEVAR